MEFDLCNNTMIVVPRLYERIMMSMAEWMRDDAS